MKINRKVFMKELSSVFPVMGKGAGNYTANNFTFKSAGEESYIATTNNTAVVIKKLPFQFPSCRVAGSTLFQLIKKLNKAEELDITVFPEHMLIKTDLPTESTVPLQPNSRNLVDMITDIPTELFKPLPDGFTDALKECHTYTTTDSSKPILQYVYADKKSVCGANGSEIVLYNLDSEVDKMFIPSQDVSLISSFKLTHYALHNNFLYFQTDNDAFIILQPASQKERYPVIINTDDYTEDELTKFSAFLPDNLYNTNGMREVHFTKEQTKDIIEVVKACELFTDEVKRSRITCKFEGGFIFFEGYSIKGKHRHGIELSEPVDNASFDVFPDILISMLERNEKMYMGKGRLIIDKGYMRHLIEIK